VLGYDEEELEARGAGATAREIAQQPGLWREVAQRLAETAAEREAFLAPLLATPARRVLLTGAGSSAFAGEIVAPAIARRARVRVDAVATTEIVANPRECFAEDVPTLLVSFARSGDSPESVAATRLAGDLLSDCAHLVITCNAEGQLNRTHNGRDGSHVLLLPEAANDRGFAMTSSLTSMALAALIALGGEPDVDRLATDAQRSLDALDTLPDLEGIHRVVYLGSGSLHGLAKESALKLLELSAGRVATFAESSLGFRHGPKAVVDDATVVVVHLSSDPYTRRYDDDIARELPGAITLESELPDAEAALVHAIRAQALALSASLALGLTPDNPFPGGGVNRVVQGVTIHDL
jgi:tagatose-6-phosphate ketose/aldose isomerase